MLSAVTFELALASFELSLLIELLSLTFVVVVALRSGTGGGAASDAPTAVGGRGGRSSVSSEGPVGAWLSTDCDESGDRARAGEEFVSP